MGYVKNGKKNSANHAGVNANYIKYFITSHASISNLIRFCLIFGIYLRWVYLKYIITTTYYN